MADLPHMRPDPSQPAGVALSREVKAIRTQAESVARGTQRQSNSVHYLIGTLLVECPARELLLEAGIDEATALDTYERLEDRLVLPPLQSRGVSPKCAPSVTPRATLEN